MHDSMPHGTRPSWSPSFEPGRRNLVKSIVILLAFFFSSLGFADNPCQDGKWTQEIPYSEGCGGVKCFRREMHSPTGKQCAKILYTVQAGYFSSKIYDPSGKLHAMETFYVDPDGHGALRIDIKDPAGKLLYYIDKEENVYLPSGEPLPDDLPNPAGIFYEFIINSN